MLSDHHNGIHGTLIKITGKNATKMRRPNYLVHKTKGGGFSQKEEIWSLLALSCGNFHRQKHDSNATETRAIDTSPTKINVRAESPIYTRGCFATDEGDNVCRPRTTTKRATLGAPKTHQCVSNRHEVLAGLIASISLLGTILPTSQSACPRVSRLSTWIERSVFLIGVRAP